MQWWFPTSCLLKNDYLVFVLWAVGTVGVQRPPLIHKGTWGRFTQRPLVAIIIIVANILMIIIHD